MTKEISNTDDMIDIRDVIARFEELRDERADLASETEDYTSVVQADAKKDLADWDKENGAELKILRALLEECKGNGGDEKWQGDWYPVGLIRDSYFQDYAQELADDIGAINKDQSWPNNCIDWERATRELQMDYTAIDFDGVTYWAR